MSQNPLIKFLSPHIVEDGFKLDWLLSRPIAHRGFHNLHFPENSLASFEEAISRNLAIELDVHLLKDGEVVVFHDETLDRMTGIKGKISSCDVQMISKVKLGSSNERIPLLRDVFSLVAGRVPIILEIKNIDYNGVLEDRICELVKNYEGHVAIQSFNPFSLSHCRRLLPEVPRGMLTARSYEGVNFFKTILLNTYALLPKVRPSYVGHHFDHMDMLPLTGIRKNQLLPILAWTIKSESDWHKTRPFCDNIIFEGFEIPKK